MFRDQCSELSSPSVLVVGPEGPPVVVPPFPTLGGGDPYGRCR